MVSRWTTAVRLLTRAVRCGGIATDDRGPVSRGLSQHDSNASGDAGLDGHGRAGKLNNHLPPSDVAHGTGQALRILRYAYNGLLSRTDPSEYGRLGVSVTCSEPVSTAI